MKIEIKNVQFSEALSEETNAFTANLYINGKKVGYCKNQGHGGCTDYRADSPEYRQIIADAEAYCKTLPKVKFKTSEWDQSLEWVIDMLMEDWLKAKEKKKEMRQMAKAILVGVPNAHTYSIYKFKVPLTQIPKLQLEMAIMRIKGDLKKGEVILNTNLKELISPQLHRTHFIK